MVDIRVSTMHHPNKVYFPPTRPVRCFRHHVSMASCGDCSRVRSAELARKRETAETAN